MDKDGPAGRDKTKTEDKPAGRDGEGTKDRTAEKDGGAHSGQDNGGSNSRYSYPLAMPGLGDVPDDSTSEQCTGTDRSTTHDQGTMDNPPTPSTRKAETGPTATATPNTGGPPGTTLTTTGTD